VLALVLVDENSTCFLTVASSCEALKALPVQPDLIFENVGGSAQILEQRCG